MKILQKILLTLFASCFITSVVHADPTISNSERIDNFAGYPASVDINVPSSDGVAVLLLAEGTNTAVVSSVTWGGVAMTEVVACRSVANSYTVRAYYLVDPSTGTSTVTVAYSTTPNVGLFGEAYVLYGVDTSNPIHGCQVASGTGAPSADITISIPNSISISSVIANATCTIPVPVSPTVRIFDGCNGTFSWTTGYRPPIADSTVTHSYSGSTAWNMNIIALSPEPSAAVEPLTGGMVKFFNRIMNIRNGFVRVGM